MSFDKISNSQLDPHLLSVLKKLNTVGKTYVVGGHLRNLFYNSPETDVDFLTLLSLEELKNFFPQITHTERGLEFGICRANVKGRQFDFSICENEDNFQVKLKDRDFTVNSAFADLTHIYYPPNALLHLEKKILSSPIDLDRQFLKSDKFHTRVFRLISEYGFSIDEKDFEALKIYKDSFFETPSAILKMESYKIIKGPFFLLALDLFESLFYPNSKSITLQKLKMDPTPSIGDNLKARLIYFHYLLEEDSIHRFLKAFCLSDTFDLNLDESLLLLKNPTSINQKDFQLFLLANRYILKDDPKKLALFLSSLQKK